MDDIDEIHKPLEPYLVEEDEEKKAEKQRTNYYYWFLKNMRPGGVLIQFYFYDLINYRIIDLQIKLLKFLESFSEFNLG